MQLTLARRVIAITAAALVPILGALAYNEVALRRSRGAEIHALALSTASQAALEMERLTSGAAGVLRAITTVPEVRRLQAEPCTAYLAALKPRLPEFTNLFVIDMEGIPVCRTDASGVPLHLSDRPYFREALAAGGALVIGGYTESRIDGNKVLPMAMAIEREDGQPVGVVATALDLDWLGALLQARQLARNASLTIADRDGVIVAREPFSDRFVGTAIPDAFLSLVHAEAPGSTEVLSQDGTTRILGYVPVEASPAGLYISAGIARADAFQAINAATRRNLLLFLAAAILAALLSWFLGNRLVRGPVARIASTLAERRAGNEETRTGMRSRDGEIEALGAEFDSYMDELASRRVERDRAEALLRATAAEKDELAQHSELLAREMSHRVMNSFQLMESLFALQTRRVTDPVAQTVIAEAGERLRAMSLVHRQLFRTTRDEMEDLDAGRYLRDLVRELGTAFLAGGAVRLEVQAEDGILLSPGRGIALGLLVTELVLNALKHAFADRDGGSVLISLEALGDGRCRLAVQDDGRGLPPAGESGSVPSAGVGMKLLDGFLRQLEGEMTVEGPPGTRFVVTFRR